MFTCYPAKMVVFAFALMGICEFASSQTNKPFDGRPWHISTGNLSVAFTQASPIGAFPRTNFIEAPPSVDSQLHLRNLGLVANEDYISWGAVETAPGQWNWQDNDGMEKTLHAAGLE